MGVVGAWSARRETGRRTALEHRNSPCRDVLHMESLGELLRTVHTRAADGHPCHASEVLESPPLDTIPASHCAMPPVSTNSRTQDHIERRRLFRDMAAHSVHARPLQ
jgi:hypothetical protein